MSANLGKCVKCGKTAYQLEAVTAGPPGKTKVYHKTCFKCATCGWQLTLTNYKAWEDQPYCQNHYPVTGFGDQNAKHVRGVVDTESKLNQTALNSPKLDTYNQTVRGPQEKPSFGSESIEINNATAAPKLETYNQTVRQIK
eukprot:TRINITY_DN7001_c0_g1_i1.p2 TRINITY_DN7001_c0_g1~~TRINITY_DN7001_c0_g1_i1.p2  ORF type:complete len:141 (+),score=34.91 TRINITY_DN7001_c0_g1_i1:133-555(+)